LTDRELQVIQLLGEGQSNKETAATLHISDQTVKNHISHIFTKLGVNDRTSAVLMAISNGWIKKTEHEYSKPVLDKDL
jgi:two-component system, NarL family, response regulator DegU